MSTPASALPFAKLETKPQANTMLLKGQVASIEEHEAVHSGKDVTVFIIQLPSPDGFRGGVRVMFIHEKRNAFRVGDAFEETVIPDSVYRRYASTRGQNAGQVVRENFPTSCFSLA